MVIKKINKINQICKEAKAYISIDRNVFIIFTDIDYDNFKGHLFDGEYLHQGKWFSRHQLGDGQYSFSQYIVFRKKRIYYNYSLDTYGLENRIKEVQEAYK